MGDFHKRRMVIWTVAGGYLLYLADELLTGWFRNETENPVVSLLGGAVFLIVGGVLLYYSWKAWRAQEKENNRDNNSSDKEQ